MSQTSTFMIHISIDQGSSVIPQNVHFQNVHFLKLEKLFARVLCVKFTRTEVQATL